MPVAFFFCTCLLRMHVLPSCLAFLLSLPASNACPTCLTCLPSLPACFENACPICLSRLTLYLSAQNACPIRLFRLPVPLRLLSPALNHHYNCKRLQNICLDMTFDPCICMLTTLSIAIIWNNDKYIKKHMESLPCTGYNIWLGKSLCWNEHYMWGYFPRRWFPC